MSFGAVGREIQRARKEAQEIGPAAAAGLGAAFAGLSAAGGAVTIHAFEGAADQFQRYLGDRGELADLVMSGTLAGLDVAAATTTAACLALTCVLAERVGRGAWASLVGRHVAMLKGMVCSD